MNAEIISVVRQGLARWNLVPEARVNYLTDQAWPDLNVPRVVLSSRQGLKPRSPVVVGATGFHAEENSGHFIFSTPDFIYPVVKPYMDRCSFVFYPQVNHHAPQYMDALGRPLGGYAIEEVKKAARANERQINYNGGWGEEFTRDNKTREGILIERDSNNFMADYDVIVGISDHEDSTAPHQGYIWVNERPLVRQIPRLKRSIERIWNGQLVCPFDTYQDMEIEWDDFVAVDVRDSGSWETYMNDQGVPTVLSEAPFGDRLADRLFFHQLVLAATLEAALQ